MQAYTYAHKHTHTHTGVPDVSIEVSGSPAALQTAIDHTGRGGRLVLGSWYGASSAPLSLGLAFHRSKLSFKCSQVPLVHVNGLRTRSGWHTLP